MIGWNLLIDVTRIQTTGTSSTLPGMAPASSPFLPAEPAREIMRPPQQTYLWLKPELVQKDVHLFAVDSGVDIVAGDYLTKVTDMDGDFWPPDTLQGTANAANENWIVRVHREMADEVQPERWFWAERVLTGGKLHLT